MTRYLPRPRGVEARLCPPSSESEEMVCNICRLHHEETIGEYFTHTYGEHVGVRRVLVVRVR